LRKNRLSPKELLLRKPLLKKLNVNVLHKKRLMKLKDLLQNKLKRKLKRKLIELLLKKPRKLPRKKLIELPPRKLKRLPKKKLIELLLKKPRKLPQKRPPVKRKKLVSLPRLQKRKTMTRINIHLNRASLTNPTNLIRSLTNLTKKKRRNPSRNPP
jgi:hypothetical protein